MRILAGIAFSMVIFLAGYYWRKNHNEVVDLSLDIGFRSLQRLVFDEVLLSKPVTHDSELVQANLTMRGRQTPVLLQALPQFNKNKFSALRVIVDEKDDYEPRHMLLINKDILPNIGISDFLQDFLIQDSPLYVNGKKIADYLLISEPFYSLVAQGNGPIVRRVTGTIELSTQSKILPVMYDVLKREESKLPHSDDKTWWYWNKKKWIHLGRWPTGWPL